MPIFSSDDDRLRYLGFLAEQGQTHGLAFLAWCLMTNHVHLIAVPSGEDGLRSAIGEAHRRYTRRVNFRQGWRGHLWQGRFCSCVMQEMHLIACIRYIEMNPVRAKLVNDPEKWLWSSAAAHISGQNNEFVNSRALLKIIKEDWKSFLLKAVDKQTIETFQKHERTGRPIGDSSFIEKIEELTGRDLKLGKPGPKPNSTN